jgi:hypothetical protein
LVLGFKKYFLETQSIEAKPPSDNLCDLKKIRDSNVITSSSYRPVCYQSLARKIAHLKKASMLKGEDNSFDLVDEESLTEEDDYEEENSMVIVQPANKGKSTSINPVRDTSPMRITFTSF